MGCLVNATTRLFYPWERDPVPMAQKAGGPQGRYGQVRNISPPAEFDLLTVQSVASRYTEHAIPAYHNTAWVT